MLTRRHAISAAIACALPSVATAAPGKASRLRMGYLLSTDSQLGAAAGAMAEDIDRATAGRIQIQQFPDAALGGEVEMLKAIQLGAIDLAMITGAALPAAVPACGIFNIPFLFNDAAHAHTVLDGPIGDFYRQQLIAKDLIALAWGENGLRHLTNARHPVATPEDLKGLKLRLPQSETMLAGFRALGADVAPLPFPQLYAALESGQFDGQENPIATIRAARFAQVQKFLTLSGHVYDPAIIVMSADAHDDLAPSDQALMLAAARRGAAASRSFAATAETSGVAALQQAGMQVVAKMDRARFVAAMAPANAMFEQQFGHDRIAEIRGA
jgi:tripartite ATP-independent transporter DctP family solute receptor